jgi:tripartite-type tricarboxylate transporter receptor subunit TctC
MSNMKSMRTKTIVILTAVSILLTLPSALLAADAYPNKPIRIIVATSPGGSNDFVARMIATKLSERFGEQVVVFNRPGGGGVIGYEMGANAAPDGYTLILASASYAALPATHKMPYDPIKAFTPIAKLGTGPFLLIAHSSVAAKSVKELIALAKQKPGEMIFGSGNVGTGPHLGTELFLEMTGIKVKLVHFKGGGPALISILGGHVEALFSNIIQSMPHIKSGKLRPLGTGGAKRSAILPDVPTVAEAADLPGYENANWWSFLAPAGTPASIVEKVGNEVKEVLVMEDVRKWFLNAGGDVDYMGPAEFGPFLEKEIAKFKRIAKAANLKMQ